MELRITDYFELLTRKFMTKHENMYEMNMNPDLVIIIARVQVGLPKCSILEIRHLKVESQPIQLSELTTERLSKFRESAEKFAIEHFETLPTVCEPSSHIGIGY